ncbi:hypothetical protein HY490_03600 [Candidatus Woesearchaeota archaeon]|nr:hypothetical protein [Candidatus Woesearchaeota archaeon]
MRYQRGSLQRHEQLKYWILAHPEIVGIDKNTIISACTEYPLRKRHRAIAQPDVVISHLVNDRVKTTFVEVKSGNGKRSRIDLTNQLRKIANYLRGRHINTAVIGVYPDADTGHFCVVTA